MERIGRTPTGMNQDDRPASDVEDVAHYINQQIRQLLSDKKANGMFQLSNEATSSADDDLSASIGLPEDCSVKSNNHYLIIKPQIALRSEIKEEAIVLLAMEEISYKAYKVLDEKVQDPIAADVLTR